jgi:peptidoglycan/LPS O-acetylase OafA/YrhL
MVFADIYASRPAFFKVRGWVSAGALIVGVYLGAVDIGSIGLPHYAILYKAFSMIGLHPLSYPWMLSSVFLLDGLLPNSWTQGVLSSEFARLLGTCSFPLFLVHTVLLCSFTSYAFLYLSHMGHSYRLAMTLAFMASLPVLACAVKCVHVVDELSTRVTRMF